MGAVIKGETMVYTLDYDSLIILDAENLAECGIKDAYETLLPELVRYVAKPAQITELIENDATRYAVTCEGTEYVIYAPELSDDEGQSWGRATWALFDMVNKQLSQSSHRFYAISGGNDLGGMFLTPEEVGKARQSYERKSDWPYLPKSEHPWYGQEY